MSIPYQALVDTMVTFYRETLDRMSTLLENLRQENIKLREEYDYLNNSFVRLELHAAEQEERAEGLYLVVSRYLRRCGREIRRDLMDEFNDAANDLDYDVFDGLIDLMESEDEEEAEWLESLNRRSE